MWFNANEVNDKNASVRSFLVQLTTEYEALISDPCMIIMAGRPKKILRSALVLLKEMVDQKHNKILK